MEKQRTYIAVDLKSFYASAECIRLGYDPLDVNLVVADESRTDKTICLAVSPAMKKYGVEAIEQCLPDWDLDGAARLRRQGGGIQLMLDESVHTTRDAARICKAEAADIMNIKLMKCGGLYRGAQISAIGESFGVTCMVGCMMETKIAITAGLSLAAAKKNITETDCDSFLYYKDGDTGMPGGFEIHQDMFRLLEKSGLGLDITF